MKIKFAVMGCIIGCIIAGCFLPVWAAEVQFPTKPIHMWIGYEAGGSTDILTRRVSKIVEKKLGQPIIVENKPGGGGALCLGLLKSAKPDGYTLAGSTDSALTRVPHLIKLNYDPIKDFTPITMLGISLEGMVVNADSPLKTFKDLIDYARQNPGKATVGVQGVGSLPHVIMEKIASIEKVKFTYVHFPGSPATITAVLGGHIMAGDTVIVTFMPHVRAGKLRPLISFDKEGIPELPDVPTTAQLYNNFNVSLVQLIVGPNGIPKPIVEKLAVAFKEATMEPEIQAMAKETGLLAKPVIGDDLNNWRQSSHDMFGALVKELGLQKKE